ncbi:reverse transcriptase [Gossypium australe]|uniref:Reverse transcriptase n=1 Tax=Gossypium australe TaxID=47621 RepID=A0A5B6W814_9ROSI|nr:reverse transcriptase [Gossypium australe]
MKIICWNVCGLRNPRAVRRLRYFCKQQNPHIVFLMETKLNQKRVERVRKSCGFSGGIDIEAEGSRGGLCLAWKDGVVVTLRSFSKWHIDVLLWEGRIRKEWRFTGFYGSPYSQDRSSVWSLLKFLSQGNNYPWLVAGDFNEILYFFEKIGGIPRDQKRMEAFRDTLEDCQLTDIGYSGVRYIWERGNLPETNIRERLDRGVANEEWLLLFPRGNIQHLTFSSSDHCPILLNTDIPTFLTGHRSFRFEAWWTIEDSFEGMIRKFWDSSSVPLMEKLTMLQIHFKKCAGSIKSKKNGLKRRLTKELESLLGKDRDDDTMAKIIDTKIHLNMEIDKDEAYWEQRARANWLKLGDKNTAFFHKYASTRRRINSITKLVSEDGREITDGSEILHVATGYFKDLFEYKGFGDPRKVLEGIESIVSHEVNEKLLSPFREDEIQTTLKDMGPTKAPGTNGFPALFFQQYWHIVGKDIVEFFLNILNGNTGVELANVTELVLIPKITNPSSLVNFRPISLCSVLYKIVAKAIANRMQNVIGMCIDEVQSAFVPGRLITDNVLLALHTFRQKRTGKNGYMAFKLDMSKAYDRVEWDFVKTVMIKMGFAHEWVGLIMKCITSVSYAVNINANRAGLVMGAKVSRRGPEISHLLFTDDCMMFGEATEQGARNMKNILEEYESCSGQCVNFHKSTIFYSSNTLADVKEVVSALLGVRSSSNLEKYLGLPNMVGRRKKEAFQSILDKISLRIDGWSTRVLSQGGREVFIKSVLQAIPTYAMSCFLLPKTVCELIENKFARFWWQKGAGRRAKQGWRLLMSPDSLVARVFKAKYFLDCSFRESNLGNSSSYAWRSIWTAKASLEKGLIWKVGTGENISIFEDSWIPNYSNDRLMSEFGNLQFVKVADLIKSNEREWNKELISNTFPEVEAELILRIPLANEPHEDVMAWKGELSGEFLGYASSSPEEIVKWRNPPGQSIKINFDAAFEERSRLSASGIVVRDSSGSVLLSSTALHKDVDSAVVAEAIACRRASQIGLNINQEVVIIEGDSLSIIKKCNKRDFDKSQVSSYIHDIHILKNRFKKVSFEFVPRSANNLAHTLATETLRRKEEVYLVNGVPSYAEVQSTIDYVREPD